MPAIRPICVPLERMLEFIDAPADARIVAHGTGSDLVTPYDDELPDGDYVYVHIQSDEFDDADQGKPLELKDATK